MKYSYFLLAIVFLTSCAPIYVTHDYEKTADFSTYKTYNYYSDLNTEMSELDDKRLINALDSALKLRGYHRSETPDFFIDIKSTEFQQANGNTVGVGVGGSGRNAGGGISIGLPLGQSELGRQIIFEFVDEDGIGLFWQAVTESNYKPNASPEKREVQFVAIVEKILKKFPPEVR